MELSAGDRRLLAATIRKVRSETGLTQTEVAARSGIDQAKISRYELGRNEPPMASLFAIDEACGHERGHILRAAGLME